MYGYGRGWRWRYYATGMPGWMRWGYLPPMHPPMLPPMDVPHPWMQWYGAGEISPEEELRMLEEEEQHLMDAIEDVRKRIDELKKRLQEKK